MLVLAALLLLCAASSGLRVSPLSLSTSALSTMSHNEIGMTPRGSAARPGDVQSLRVKIGPAGTFPVSLHRFQASAVPSLKLPVWPVHFGVVAQALEWLSLPDLAETLIEKVGGRVVPIQLGSESTSPFLLLAHHAHSFTPFDPIRAITKALLPEGFPAHPHSGFSTLTFCLEGGLRHRDSEGLKMRYGDGDVQWMRAGRGTIHEEMWDVFSPTPQGEGEGEGEGGGQERHQRIELFQLWVNSPQSGKFCDPQVQHLRAKDVQVLSCSPTAQAHIICGAVSLGQEEGHGQHVVEGGLNAMCHSPLAVLRLTAAPGERLEVAAPRGCTFLLYVRRGSVIVPPRGKGEEQGQRVRINSLVMFESGDAASQSESQGQGQDQEEQGEEAGEEKDSEWSVGEVLAGPSGLDALLLLGEPLSEPVVMGGPFVHASAQDYKAAADAFSAAGAVLGQQGGASSVFWPHTLSDEAWRAHVARLGLQRALVDRLGR